MLVALALLGWAAALGVDALSVEQRGVVYTRYAAARADDVAAAQNQLRDKLKHLFANSVFTNSGAVSVDVSGHADWLEFTSEAAAPVPQLRRFRLALARTGDLTLASDASGPAPAFAAPQLVLADVKSLAIDYLPQRAAIGKPPATWVSDWQAQAAPPELIRVRLTFHDADKRTWPDLIVRPSVTVDDACSVDQDTGGCRGRS